jgi:hypothetical protein
VKNRRAIDPWQCIAAGKKNYAAAKMAAKRHAFRAGLKELAPATGGYIDRRG